MNTAYFLYLHSPEWQALREKALAYADHHCQVCYGTLNLHVHHRKYPKVLGHERMCDLTVLCEKCHNLCHKKEIAKKKMATYHKKKAAPSSREELRPIRFKHCR